MAAQMRSHAALSPQERSRLPPTARSRYLQPLVAPQTHAARQRDMMQSYLHPLSSPTSALSRGSPTLLATRQYYLENQTHLSPVEESPRTYQPQYPGGLAPYSQDSPRGHSGLMTPIRLSNHLSRVNVSSPRQQSPIASASGLRPLADQSRIQLLDGLGQGELVRLGTIVPRPHPVEPRKFESDQRGNVPLQYIHERLHNRGQSYLGNMATADAFVKAVHLRKPTKQSPEVEAEKEQAPMAKEQEAESPSTKVKESEREEDSMAILSETKGKENPAHSINTEKPLPGLPPSSPVLPPSPFKFSPDTDLVTIRARVHPKAKERKPFLIQRQFNMRELRDSYTNRRASDTDMKYGDKNKDIGIGRSKYVDPTGGTAIGGMERRKRGDGGLAGSKRGGVMPIHIDYIFPVLPVLAALLLSGHIRKGDTIDLPIPHPEVWDQVIEYIYTGEGEVSGAMREDIEFLGGLLNERGVK